ncbi:kinesin family protein, partial [Ascoidea rubescens DSM 1968]
MSSPYLESLSKVLSNTISLSLNTASNTNTGNVKVIARFRPENEQELSDPFASQVVTFSSNKTVNFKSNDTTCSFTFDRVFSQASTQLEIFDYSINQTVNDLFKGYNGTILAYGQTGSGKTYTMMGKDIEDIDSKGLIPRITERIFEYIVDSSSDIEFTVGVSYMEIYMEQIRDLLVSPRSQAKLSIHEDKENGIYVKGLKKIYVSSVDDIYDVMRQGSEIRVVSSTSMNQESSRSHAIFQIELTQRIISSGTIKKGNLFLVDLAGSEKVGKTGASGIVLEEAKKINSSLSSLGNVINALTDGKSTHIPYRDSKLTRILQESLGGNSRTSLIINCSPSKLNDMETLSTLRFGARAKKIQNKAHINTELSSSELKKKVVILSKNNEFHQKYINQLEQELILWRSGNPPQSSNWL